MGECSASTVWRRVQDGTLPKPHKIGGMTVWNENEVDERLGLGTRDEPEAA
jgi:predicted DNA-binding transcriptional regulator AlpA